MTDLRYDSPESLAWQAAQDAATRAYLGGLASFATFQENALAGAGDGPRWPVRRRGSGWFQLRMPTPEADLPVVTVRRTLADQPRVLFDPNELAAKRGVPVKLHWAEPSPDGLILAVGVAAAGTEVVEVSLLDVRTGALLPDSIPWNVTYPVSWLPDSSGFWCSGREVRDGTFSMSVYRYLLGAPIPIEPVRMPADLLFPRPVVSPNGRHIGIVTGNNETRLDYVLTPDGQVRPLLKDVPGRVASCFDGDDLIVVSDHEASRGRLVRIPVGTAGDVTTWTELVPEGDDVLFSVEVVADRIVLGYLRAAAAGIRVLAKDGSTVRTLELPGAGSVCSSWAGVAGVGHLSIPMFEAGAGEISFIYADFATSPAIYRYAVETDQLDIVDAPETVIDGLTVTLIEGVARDGTRVPAHVVHRADLDLTKPHPTLVTGYGGFYIASMPYYLGALAQWTEAGGIFVLSHPRGGGEYGRDWWLDGSRAHKQHTFDDLFAVAERLVELGLATPRGLAMYGISNGGVLAGAAVAQRPDLWAAVVSDVPILDLTRMHEDPLSYEIVKGEYGDALIPEEAAWLRSYSPLQSLVEADYPATLVIAGSNDPRCPTWHSRLFVERLRALDTGSAPVLLRVHADQGHGSAGAVEGARRTCEWLAFCAEHTGLTP